MTSQLHHTRSADRWITDIVPQLPPDLEQQARAFGAFVRVRKLQSASDLLRGLLTYVTQTGGLRALGVWGVLQDVADMAHSSWWERLRKATDWLQWIVKTMLHQPRPTWLDQPVRGRVLLVDATMLGWQGGSGQDLRLHLAYDLIAEQMDQVVLTDVHGAEHVSHFQVRAGDLLIWDGGYGYRSRYAPVQQAQADVIGRIYPSTFPLETADGRSLDVRTWLDRQRSDQTSQRAYYRHDGQRYAVRVLALRLPEPQRQAARHRAKERARKRQRELFDAPLYFADWIILVTTLLDQQTWPDAVIWRLYAARWQIELLFKRLKQFLDLQHLPCETLASAEAYVWALLIVWVLHEPERAALQATLQQLAAPHPRTLPGQLANAEAVVSRWGLSDLLLQTVCQAIWGTWSIARVRACLPRLCRYLVSHPRQDREHQATEVCARLRGIRLTRRKPLLDAA